MNSGGNNMEASRSSQGGQTTATKNGPFVPDTNNAADDGATNPSPMNGSFHPGGSPRAKTVAMMQVKTGESIPPFRTSGWQQQQQSQHQKQQHEAHHVPCFNTSTGHSGGNKNGEITRSSSEPMMSTMMLDDFLAANNDPLGFDNGPAGRSFNQEQLGRDGQNNYLPGGAGHGMNNTTTYSSSSGISCGGMNRHHSEPTLNLLLAEIFDEPTAGEHSKNSSGNSMNTSAHSESRNMLEHADGWSSPPPQMTSNRQGGRKRSNSEPLMTDALFDLDTWEPERATDDVGCGSNGMSHSNNMTSNFSSSGGGSGGNGNNRSEAPWDLMAEMFSDTTMEGQTSNTCDSDNVTIGAGLESVNILRSTHGWSSPPPEEKILVETIGRKRCNSAPLLSDAMFDSHSSGPEKFPAKQTVGPPNKQLQWGVDQGDWQGFARNDSNNRSNNGGRVKRSRSVDPLEMFRRVEDETGLLTHVEHNDGCGDDTQEGPSEEGQQRLDSVGTYSREKPKRRRSAPLLAQDLFQDLFKLQSEQDNQLNNQFGSSLTPADPSAPPNPVIDMAPPRKNSNANLIHMLIGVETENSETAGTNDANGGQSQVIHQRMPGPMTTAAPQQLRHQHSTNNGRLGPVMPQQHLQSNRGSMPHVIHQPMSRRTHQSIPMPTALQSPQQFASKNSRISSDRAMLNSQQNRNLITAPASTNTSSSQAPLSINNSEDLSLFLSAVKETQSNLRALEPMVMQVGDPMVMEDFAAAFKITASSSDFVLASDLASAYSALNDAWATIKRLEGRLGRGPKHSQQHNFVHTSNIPAIQGDIGYIPQAGQNQIGGGIISTKNGHSAVGMWCPPQSPSTDSAFAPTTQLKIEDQLIQESKLPNGASKSKKKARKKIEPVVEQVVELKDLPPQNKDDPKITLERLQALMIRTQVSQKQLQKWDKDNGLPRSHSQTMVNSGRSRKQLQKGVVLRKWNGDPLISGDGSTAKEESEEDKEEQTSKETNDSQKGDAASSETVDNDETPSFQEDDSGVFNNACGIAYTAHSHVSPIWALGKCAPTSSPIVDEGQ